MVANRQRLPLVVGERINIATATAVIRKHLQARRRAALRAAIIKFTKAIEPWYDWGVVETFSLKLLSDKSAGPFGDESMGNVRFFTFQWLGLHLHFEIGRTPTSVR